MKAIRIERFGGPEVMTVAEVARPVPSEGEVLVRVAAAGVGPWDAWIRSGHSVLPQPLPLTLGSELAGIVEELGPGVRDFAVGDAVFGATNPRFIGAYAELAIASATMLAPAPARVDAVAAASIPIVAVTAWQMLFDEAKVTAGQRVLVHGAAGNVGAYAVQLAKRAGAHVVATASARDLEEVRRLGADETIDHRGQRFEEVTQPVDVVIDTVGGEVLSRSLSLLAPGGVLVSAVAQPDAREAERRGVRATFLLVQTTRPYLEQIAGLIDNNSLTTHVGLVLPLAEARRAHELLDGTAGPRPPGKIVLRVSDMLRG